jgi:predicted metalloendopeptidase
MKRTLCNTLIVGLFAGAAHAGAPAAAPTAPASVPSIAAAASPRAGVDVAAFDTTVRPQDDFFRYTQGKWLKDVDIPSDRSSWGAFNVAQDKVEQQIRALIEQAAQDKPAKAGSDARKMGDFYNSYIDEKRRNALGLEPLKRELASVGALRDKHGLAALIAYLNRLGAGAPIDIGVHQDNKDSTRYIADIGQSGLGMPDRDYYIQADDARLADVRAKYQAHIEKMLALAGHANAAGEAGRIMALETGIARAQWSAVENRDPVKAYNKVAVGQLKTLMSNFDWNAYLKGVGVAGKADAVIVSQPTYLARLDTIIQSTPLDVWKSYFELRLLSAYAPYLSQPFVDESFAFRGAVLSGAKVNRPLEKRAIAEINRDLGEVVGKAYVGAHFPAERKQQVEDMVKNFLAAFKERIDTLDWMTAQTKQQAQVKLAKISVKVGYPNKLARLLGVGSQA